MMADYVDMIFDMIIPMLLVTLAIGVINLLLRYPMRVRKLSYSHRFPRKLKGQPAVDSGDIPGDSSIQVGTGNNTRDKVIEKELPPPRPVDWFFSLSIFFLVLATILGFMSLLISFLPVVWEEFSKPLFLYGFLPTLVLGLSLSILPTISWVKVRMQPA
ncbi:hypothetical protein GF325_00905 [Candidatus Bathyarchaeota archaeon]|nr:hypothetical protein [Candidatus Bathyarchaeota archaeon]